MSESRIGAFGGTFDPIHNAHIQVARAVVRNFKLDRLLIIPAHRPPHKTTNAIANAYHRYAMAVLATLDESRLEVSTIELEAPERPYSFETIGRLRSALGSNATLFFVVGADSFEEIHTWREPALLLSSTDLIVVSRPGHELNSSGEFFGSEVIDLRRGDRAPDIAEHTKTRRVYLTDYVDSTVSSTGIRQRVLDGESIAEQVPEAVSHYIEKYSLYR